MRTINTISKNELNGWRICRSFPAAVLLFASCSKIYYSFELTHSDGMLSRPGILIFVILCEIASAYLIIASPLIFSWRTTVYIFVTLTAVSIYSMVTGYRCNCFGASVPSWLISSIDLFVLATCFCLKPVGNIAMPSMQVIITAAMVGTVGASAAFANMRFSKFNSEVILADRLIGEDWPFDERYNSELSIFAQGKWLIFILRKDCEHCDELLRKYIKIPTWHRFGERTAVFVADDQGWEIGLDRVHLHGPFLTQIVWKRVPFVAVPAVFEVVDGKIIAAADGAASDEFLARISLSQ